VGRIVETSGPARTYVPQQYALKAFKSVGSETATAWPVTGVDLAAATECAVVEGEAAAALTTSLIEAESSDAWDQAGVVYTVGVRPIIPGEETCA
jgi:hypothetical protein